MSLCSAAPSQRQCLDLVREWHRDRFDAWCRNTGPHSLGGALGLAPADRPPILEAQPSAWDCFSSGRRRTTLAECITRKLTLAVAVYAARDTGRAQPILMLPVLASSTVLEPRCRTDDYHCFVLDGVARVLPLRRVRMNVPVEVGSGQTWAWGHHAGGGGSSNDAVAAFYKSRPAWDIDDLATTFRCLTVDAALHILVSATRSHDSATRTAAVRSALATGNWLGHTKWTGVTHMAKNNSVLAHVAQLTTFNSPNEASTAQRQLLDGAIHIVDIFATSEGQKVGLTAALVLERLRCGASTGNADPDTVAQHVVAACGGPGDVPAALVNGHAVLACALLPEKWVGLDALLADGGVHARWHGGAWWFWTLPGLFLDASGSWLGSADRSKSLRAADVIGCVSHASPYIGFNQGSRATFSYNMMQHAAGLGVDPCAPTSRLPRLKDHYVLETAQSPLVTTCPAGPDDLACGTGITCSVAVLDSLAHGGNPEDAVLVSQRFADLGGLGLRRYTTVEATEDGLRGKRFGRPVAAGAQAIMVDDDGLIAAGTVIGPNDTLATFVDGSAVRVPQRWETTGQVESVAITQADNGDRTATIRLVACGIGLMDGDKIVPRSCSQKGTIRLLPAHEMPWSPVPECDGGFDIIFSASALPSRMTPGYLLELSNGLLRLGLAQPTGGNSAPAQLFGQPGVRPLADTMAQCLGRVPLKVPVHDGATGVLQLGGGCCVGFAYTTTLYEHRAKPKCYGKTRFASRLDALTGQPLKGRASGGSGRCGEMEKDGIVLHGAMSLLQDRMAAGGSGGGGDDDRAVRLLQAELAGCGIEMKFG